MSAPGRSQALIPERDQRDGTPAGGPLLLTMGDAAGIGPEIVLRAFLQGQAAGCVVVGDPAVLRRAGSPMTAAMKSYEKKTWKNVGLYWEFIENFYQLNFAQIFFQPVNKCRMVCAINSVLAGRTDLTMGIRIRLRVFFFLAWLNKYVPVVERIRIG